MSMLTGDTRPTAGDATLCGHSVWTDLIDIFKLTGFCNRRVTRPVTAVTACDRRVTRPAWEQYVATHSLSTPRAFRSERK